MNTSQKLCECGCGRETNTAPDGKPRRFIRGHNRRGTGNGWAEQGHWYISIGGKKKALHRHVVEQRLGRTLLPGEVVHHIDGNPRNNAPENLTVLSRAEHIRLHSPNTSARWTIEERRRAHDLRRQGFTVQEVAWAMARSYYGTRLQLAKAPPPA